MLSYAMIRITGMNVFVCSVLVVYYRHEIEQRGYN